MSKAEQAMWLWNRLATQVTLFCLLEGFFSLKQAIEELVEAEAKEPGCSPP
jgi:hypothetical protein